MTAGAFVLDASAAAAAFLPDETSLEKDVLIRTSASQGVLVPDLFWHELRNVLLVAERKGRTQPGFAENTLRDVHGLNPVVAPPLGSDAVFDTARRYDLTAYDAAYARLAIETERPLATLDKDLLRLGAAGVLTLWSPPAQ